MYNIGIFNMLDSTNILERIKQLKEDRRISIESKSAHIENVNTNTESLSLRDLHMKLALLCYSYVESYKESPHFWFARYYLERSMCPRAKLNLDKAVNLDKDKLHHMKSQLSNIIDTIDIIISQHNE